MCVSRVNSPYSQVYRQHSIKVSHIDKKAPSLKLSKVENGKECQIEID